MQTSQHHRNPTPKPLGDWLDEVHAQAQAERFAEQARTHAAFVAQLAAYRATQAARVQPTQGATQ